MTVEVLNNLIPTLDIDDVEQLLMDFMTVIQILENKTFDEVIEEYNVKFIDNIYDFETSKNQIEKIYKMQSKIMNR